MTLDAHDDIPVVDGKRYRAWRVADWSADGLDGYRSIREELSWKIDALVVEIAPRTPSA